MIVGLEQPQEESQVHRIRYSPGGSIPAHMMGNVQPYSASMGWRRTEGNDPHVERLPGVEA